MNQSIVLGIGTGRCGLRSLAKILTPLAGKMQAGIWSDSTPSR